MAEIVFENGRISNFQGLVTWILDWVILHTIVHHSLTSTYIPNSIKIEESFCEQTDIWRDGHLRPTLLGRLKRVDLKTFKQHLTVTHRKQETYKNSV